MSDTAILTTWTCGRCEKRFVHGETDGEVITHLAQVRNTNGWGGYRWIAQEIALCPICLPYYHPCADCDTLVDISRLRNTRDGRVCPRCECNYTSCDNCGELVPNDEVDDDDYCNNCSGNQSSNCPVRNTTFTIPVNEILTISNDTEHPFSVTGGELSEEGWTAVRRYLRGETLYTSGYTSKAIHVNISDDVGGEAVTKEGRLVKRIERWYKSNWNVKLTVPQLSHIGNLIGQHMTESRNLSIFFTRELDQPASFFFHSGSCWWGGYSISRCLMKQIGGMGVLLRENGHTIGRAWLIPLGDRWQYTTRTDTTRWLLFNVYGGLNSIAFSKALCTLLGLTYDKIHASTNDRIYINGEIGYVLHPFHDTPPGDMYLDLEKDCDCKSHYG